MSSRERARRLRVVREIYDEPNIEIDEVSRLPGARVVWKDSRAVRRVFGSNDRTASVRKLNDEALDRWIVRNAAVMSRRQLVRNSVNDDIPHDGEFFDAFRPPRYGRAAVVTISGSTLDDASDDGLASSFLDLKGVGVGLQETPRMFNHGNGLLSAVHAFQEVVYHRAIESIMVHAGVPARSNRILAIIDCGFEFRRSPSSSMPAAILVRQAHRRSVGNQELPTAGSELEAVKLALELTLRRYGICSTTPPNVISIRSGSDGPDLRFAGRTGAGLGVPTVFLKEFLVRHGLRAPVDIDLSNIQLARDFGLVPLSGTFVDFGHYGVFGRFRNCLGTSVEDKGLNVGRVVRPEDSLWTQPDAHLSFHSPLTRMADTDTSLVDLFGLRVNVQRQGITNFCLRLAALLGCGSATDSVQRTLDGYVSKVCGHLSRNRRAAP